MKDADGFGDEKILHVSIPFCDSICSFCGALRFVRDEHEINKYLSALKNECEMYSNENYTRSGNFGALYLHGGTPTVLPAESLCGFIEFCLDRFNFKRHPEITVESTIHNIDEDKMRRLINSGVSRLYLGVQSFDDGTRKNLNRISSSRDVSSSIRTAHDLGFDCIRIDLMYRLPGQTMAQWESDLIRSVNLGIENITVFQLHLYPEIRLNGMIKRSEIPPPSCSEMADAMFQRAVTILEDAGYTRQYPSGFVLPGKESRYHDLYYKHQAEGIGLGVTEWFYSLLGCYNYINTNSLEKYIQMVDEGIMPISKIYEFSEEEMMKRYVLRSIRSGINKRMFIKKFGASLDDVFGKQMGCLRECGLICEDGDEVKLTSSELDRVDYCMDVLAGSL